MQPIEPTIPELVRVEKARRERLRRKAKSSLIRFTEYTKPEYQTNWHHVVIADALQKWAFSYDDDDRNLIIVAPPRHGKSELVSRRAPPFIFGHDPSAQVLSCTYGQDLSDSMSKDVKRIMSDVRYRQLFPDVQIWHQGQGDIDTAKMNTVKEWHLLGNTGVYLCSGVRGAITGRGFTHGIVDDPFKDEAEAMSQSIRDAVYEWFWSDFWTRRAPKARVCLMATRWHHDDLIGRTISEDRGIKWKVIHLPAEMPERSNKEHKRVRQGYDKRKPGEYLWPERYGKEELAPLKKSSRIWNGKYQGEPTPEEGNLIKRRWFRRYESYPLHGFESLLFSVDCAFKDTKSSSRVCISLYGQRPAPFQAQVYLLDQVCDQLSFTKTITELKGMVQRWADAGYQEQVYHAAKLIEDKANGPAVIDTLKDQVPGIIPYTPKGSKYARMVSCEPSYEAGNVFYPVSTFKVHGSLPVQEWITEHEDEIASFPFAKFNDRVDAESQALNYFARRAFKVRFGRPDEEDAQPNGNTNGQVNGMTHKPGPDPQTIHGEAEWESFGLF